MDPSLILWQNGALTGRNVDAGRKRNFIEMPASSREHLLLSPKVGGRGVKHKIVGQKKGGPMIIRSLAKFKTVCKN